MQAPPRLDGSAVDLLDRSYCTPITPYSNIGGKNVAVLVKSVRTRVSKATVVNEV